MVAIDELKRMSKKELEDELKKSALDLLKLRMGVASRQLKETSKLKILRKYIARIKTVKRAMATERVQENPVSAVTK